MPRYKAKTDTTQQDIIDGLREYGCTVVDLSKAGRGVPDLLVGWRHDTFLVECKTNLNKGEIERFSYTDAQIRFHAMWTGKPIISVSNAEDAWKAIRIQYNRTRQ